MPSLNRVFLLGNLTKDPTTKTTAKGIVVTEVSMAINRPGKDESGNQKNEVFYADVVLFGKVAQIASQYLKKSRPVFIEGRLRYEQWEKDGQKRSKLSIIGEGIQLLPDRQQEDVVQERPAPAAPVTYNEHGEPSDIDF